MVLECPGFRQQKQSFFSMQCFAFLGSKLRDFDGVYDHGIGVVGFGS